MVIRNKKQKSKKGQTFSIDVLVVIVIVLFGVLFLVMNTINDVENNPQDINELQEETAEETKIIVDEFKTNTVLDIENNVEVENLLQVDMEKLKQDLNIKNDFCIVFEKDGKLVKIDPENGINGIGSTEDIIINGVPCTIS